MSKGAWDSASEDWTWYLNATCVLPRVARLTEYSPCLSGEEEMKAGFGATFSRFAKFSRRIFSVPKGEEKLGGLYARAISPMREELVSLPLSKRALIVSIMEVFRPDSWRSGCLDPPWLPVVVAERMDWVSAPVAARESGFGKDGEACSAAGENGENGDADDVLDPKPPEGDCTKPVPTMPAAAPAATPPAAAATVGVDV